MSISDQQNGVVIFGCGNVGPSLDIASSYSEYVLPTLQTADLRIAQCERVYSDRGELKPHAAGTPHHIRQPRHMAKVFADCGFDVVSLAGNHAMDFGPDPLLDTLDLFQEMGIAVIGAGRNIDEARHPAIFERKGVKIAVLAYCSILREDDIATKDMPGIVPLRAHTAYEPVEDQPGMPPRVLTTPHAADLADLVTDIEAAKSIADVVVVWPHWGIHFIPRVIADYQETIALAAFGAGADIVIGHHAHVPKAIAMYGGRACFFSVGNFIMASPAGVGGGPRKKFGIPYDPEWPVALYGPDGMQSVIARAVVDSGGVNEVSFIPLAVDKLNCPHSLSRDEARFDEVVRYMEWASEGFPHRFDVRDDGSVLVSDPLEIPDRGPRDEVMRSPNE